MWKALADAPKCQQLTTLHCLFDDTTRRLSVCAPVIVTPDLLKMTLPLGFHINQNENLGTGVYQFCLGQHT